MTGGELSELVLVPAEATFPSIDGNRELHIAVPFLDYVINGRSLRESIQSFGYGNDLVTGLCRAWPGSTERTVDALLGGGSGYSDGVDMLVCQVCGDRDCGALLADVTVEESAVTWHNWHFTWFAATEAVQGLPSVSFDRADYEAALRAAPAAAARLPYDEGANRPRRFLWPWQWGWRLPPSG